MGYVAAIRAASEDPQQLEQLYGVALKEGAAAEFRDDLLSCYAESPDNKLYGAWYYRFQGALGEDKGERHQINWRLAIPMSVLTGLALGALAYSDIKSILTLTKNLPYIMILWSPIVAWAVLAYVTCSAGSGRRRALLLAIGLLLVTTYVTLLSDSRPTYRELMVTHLPVLSFAAVGIMLVTFRPSPESTFAFLSKAIEVVVTAGVYVIAVSIFTTIVLTMVQALDITLHSPATEALYIGVGGLVPLIAVASVYDPTVGPLQQDFRRGLSKMVALLPRLLLPLTLLVLVAYIIAIPFNFWAPFVHRDALVTYNAMLFAVMALLAGATPLRVDDLSPKYQRALRNGICAVSALVVLVSLYALSATAYRTATHMLTVNRLAIIGWNTINVGLLVFLLVRQIKGERARWPESLHEVFRVASYAYLAWAGFLALAIPWMF